jgi:hypothetical protein
VKQKRGSYAKKPHSLLTQKSALRCKPRRKNSLSKSLTVEKSTSVMLSLSKHLARLVG